MIDCVCANVSHKIIIDKIKEGFGTIEKLNEELNVCCCCKLCEPYIQNYIKKHQNTQKD